MRAATVESQFEITAKQPSSKERQFSRFMSFVALLLRGSKIEPSRSKLRGIFFPYGFSFTVRSLAPGQAPGNALAVGFKMIRCGCNRFFDKSRKVCIFTR
jgi:hypothetical protein